MLAAFAICFSLVKYVRIAKCLAKWAHCSGAMEPTLTNYPTSFDSVSIHGVNPST